MNETTTTRLGDIAEQIGSISATISAISDGIQDRITGRAMCFLADLLDQAVEDIYSVVKADADMVVKKA